MKTGTKPFLALETPRANNLGYRVAVSTVVLDDTVIDSYLRRAAGCDNGEDYLSVSHSVTQPRASGIEGREGTERIILVHPGMSQCSQENRDRLERQLRGMLEVDIPLIVKSDAIWYDAQARTIVHLDALNTLYERVLPLLPTSSGWADRPKQGSFSDTPSSPAKSQGPSKPRSPNPAFAWRISALAVVFVAIIIILAVRSVWFSSPPGGENSGKSPAESYDFLPEGWARPETPEQETIFKAKVDQCINTFRRLLSGHTKGTVTEGIQGWLNTYVETAADAYEGPVDGQIDLLSRAVRDLGATLATIESTKELDQWQNQSLPRLIKSLDQHQEAVMSEYMLESKDGDIMKQFISDLSDLQEWNR